MQTDYKTLSILVVDKENSLSLNSHSVTLANEGYRITVENLNRDNIIELTNKDSETRQKNAGNLLFINSDKFHTLLKLLNLEKPQKREIHYNAIRNPTYQKEKYNFKVIQPYIEKLNNDLVLNTTQIVNVKDRLLFNNFIQMIQKNYQETNLRREYIAKALGVSDRHLNRKFIQYNIICFSHYLRKYRLREALLLMGKGLQVAQIGDYVGFSSTTYFCSCFKKEIGATVKSLEKKIRYSIENTEKR